MSDIGAFITNVKLSTPDLEFSELNKIIGLPTSITFCRSAAKLGWIEYQAFKWVKDPFQEKNWRDCIELIDDSEEQESNENN